LRTLAHRTVISPGGTTLRLGYRIAYTMKVSFMKTGARRDGVLVQREHAAEVVMNPAPGYDEYLPHDMLHFVAEAEWKLDGAVFGQLAAGGDAGTFYPTHQSLIPRAMRDRKRRKRRAGKPKGRRSEVLVHILEHAWSARHGRKLLPNGWEEQLDAARVSSERLERVVDQLDELANRWHSLRVGEQMSLEWPRPERR
jgi:hypothetical protein